MSAPATWREVAALLAAALGRRCQRDGTCACDGCAALGAFDGKVREEAARVAAECPGEGACHGPMKWCEVCGDVARVCDDPHCEQHARPGYQRNPARDGHFGAGGRIESGRLPDGSDERGPTATSSRESSPPSTVANV